MCVGKMICRLFCDSIMKINSRRFPNACKDLFLISAWESDWIVLIELRLNDWMPRKYRLPRVVDHVEPVISSDCVVLAYALVQSNAARSDCVWFVWSTLHYVKLCKIKRLINFCRMLRSFDNSLQALNYWKTMTASWRWRLRSKCDPFSRSPFSSSWFSCRSELNRTWRKHRRLPGSLLSWWRRSTVRHRVESSVKLEAQVGPNALASPVWYRPKSHWILSSRCQQWIL